MNKFSIISLNVWNMEQYEKRKPALQEFLSVYQSDIFCFQEVRPCFCKLFDATLASYHRIRGAEPGWEQEESICYNPEVFKEIEHGVVDLHMPESMRGLFWTRFQLNDGKRLVVANVHLTHQLNETENRTGIPFRPAEARIIAKKLPTIANGDGIVLAGDFNDPVQPTHIFVEEGGFLDVFQYLHVPAPCTFPCIFLTNEDWQVESIDKMMVRNGVRPLMATSPHFHIPGFVLSDHWPIMGMFSY
jgi:endonuclease/exonuclease/phosphatase family metal-dependent hydrolase